MTEIAQNFEYIEPQHTEREYSHNSLNIHFRWELNKYAEEPLDFYNEAFRGIGQSIYGESSNLIADVGSADGTTGLAESIKAMDVRASVIGIEPSFNMLSTVSVHQFPKLLSFAGAEAERLPFADNSFQGLISLFTLYHTSDPIACVKEMKRVIEPGGIVAISTNDPGNKLQHRHFERLIASRLGIPKLLAPAHSFNTETANLVLPAEFEVIDIKRQSCDMVIKDKQGVLDYADSLYSMSDYYEDPTIPRLWRAEVRTKILPFIERIVETKGLFVDRFERSLYICRVNK